MRVFAVVWISTPLLSGRSSMMNVYAVITLFGGEFSPVAIRDSALCTLNLLTFGGVETTLKLGLKFRQMLIE